MTSVKMSMQNHFSLFSEIGTYAMIATYPMPHLPESIPNRTQINLFYVSREEQSTVLISLNMRLLLESKIT